MSRAGDLWQWLCASLQSAAGYPVRLPGSPPIADEVQLISFVVQTPELSAKLKAFGIDPAAMISAMDRCKPTERGSIKSVLKVVHGMKHMTVPAGHSSPRTPRNLFASQIKRGNPAIRAALEDAGIEVRSLMFYLAHGEHEANYTMVAPDRPGSTYGVEMLNDDFTAMEFVVGALSRHFGMARADAIKFMLEVHRKGGAVLSQASMAQAAQAAAAANADARQHYFPLLCRVVAQPVAAAPTQGRMPDGY
jgi:ATP-dependent Clp protease adaptor protein ClpS